MKIVKNPHKFKLNPIDERYVLCGWYEVEYGAERVYVRGKDLRACVNKLVESDADFGHTDAELEGGYITAEYDVTSEAVSMALEVSIETNRKRGIME
jgi:hypothetical protein